MEIKGIQNNNEDSSEWNLSFQLTQMDGYYGHLKQKERKKVDALLQDIYILLTKNAYRKLDPILFLKERNKLAYKLSRLHYEYDVIQSADAIVLKLEELINNFCRNGYWVIAHFK